MTALEGLQIYQTKITDNGLQKLRGLRRLKHIKLGYNGITDAGLKHIENLTSLENIWLDFNPITDEGLSYLAGMKNLKQLYIPRTKVTDAGLVHLKGMKDFDHLLVNGIGDEGIRHLSELPAMETLQIHDAEITKASIPDFKPMSSLSKLLISGDRVNDDLLDALRAALPNCKIWDPQRSLDYPMPEWRKRFEAVYSLEDDQVLINQTESSGQIQIPYRNHLNRLSSSLGRMADQTEKAEKLTMVLNNVSRQTNLQFQVTRRPVEVWHVSEVDDAR